MPGNPDECRQHALECVRLAQNSSTPQGRDHFAKLARGIRPLRNLSVPPLRLKQPNPADHCHG
jgi:hypothetical protein